MTIPSDTGAGHPPDDPTAAPAVADARPTPARPRRFRAFLVGLVLAAALATFLFVGLDATSGSGSGGGDGVSVGSTAPNFTLPSVLGAAPVSLYALGKHRHHPVILNFFASWCPPCRAETPLLASTARAEEAKGSVLQFVGVDAADQQAAAVPFIRQSGIGYPVGQDPNGSVAGRYGIYGEPQTFFIDGSGVVVGHHQGALTKVQLDAWVHRLAGGR